MLKKHSSLWDIYFKNVYYNFFNIIFVDDKARLCISVFFPQNYGVKC